MRLAEEAGLTLVALARGGGFEVFSASAPHRPGRAPRCRLTELVYMANQIATFFASQPRENQAGRVADHLRDFWEPRCASRCCRSSMPAARV